MVIILNRIIKLIAVSLLVFALATVFETNYWFFGILAEFRFWFFSFGLLLILFLSTDFKNNRLLVGLSLLAVGYHLFFLYPFLGLISGELVAKEVSESATVFYANINSQNREKTTLINHLRLTSPDLVLLVEVNKAWADKLKTLEDIYPHAKAILREGNFGVAILSKEKINVEKTFVDRENLIPGLLVSSNVMATPLKVMLLHSFPPLGKYGTMLRDRYLSTLARSVPKEEGAVLVCGDFNTAPWTSVFRNFKFHSKLESVQSGMVKNSWPASFVSVLPIDHCLSRKITVHDYSRGPYIGSDHRPLILRVSAQET